jgi:VanZ family protein
MGTGARLSVAIAASAAVVFAAPFVGEIRGAIQAAFPGQYRAIVGSIVGGAILVALAGAASQIRDRRRLRYALLGLSLLIGVGYALATSSGNPEVDAVERFHFIEYGLLALLYHRVWRDRNDLSSFALPLLAGLLVGIADEWLQWFIPFRVGEMRDVLLNGVALTCGLLFGAGLNPPARLVPRRSDASRMTLAATAAVTIACASAFFHTVHLGSEVHRTADVRFLSRFSAGALAAASRDRAARWGGAPPVERRFSREDHYLSEGLWHVQERNRAVTAGDWRTAWEEHVILEVFYRPVLDVRPGDRWTPEQRADVEARAGGGSGAFSSDAHPYPIYVWPGALFWVIVAGVIGAVAAAGLPRVHSGRPGAGQPV